MKQPVLKTKMNYRADIDARIVLTGGGSGGHITPLIAVAREMIKLSSGVEIRYIGGNGMTKELFAQEDIIVDIISSGKMRRYFSFSNVTDVFRMLLGVIQALWRLYWYMPDVVFSKGGHGALPVVFAAVFYRVPIVVHESDSVPGVVNKWTGKHAVRVAISFSSAKSYFPEKRVGLVGNPIRMRLLENLNDQTLSKKRFALQPNEPVLLVLGGSQGSERINDFILDVLQELIRNFQVIHQVGNKNYDAMKAESEVVSGSFNSDEKERYKLFGFFGEDQFQDALNAADIVVTRAGSGALFEIAAFGKPSVVIPLVGSAGNHQKLNALEYYKAGCCITFEEENLLPHLFIDQLAELLADRERREKMIEACHAFARPEAAKTIAREILALSGI